MTLLLFSRFSAYIGSSRNLKVLSEEGDIRRQKCLHRGKLSIVSFLDSLPKTEHDPNSFTLDVTLATEATIVFSITGLFRERNDPARVKPIRSFSRYFVLTKVGDGWNIINDMLYLSFPTKSQLNVSEEHDLSSSSGLIDQGLLSYSKDSISVAAVRPFILPL